MKIAICDDLKSDRDILKNYTTKYFIKNNTKVDIYLFESGDDLLEKFSKGKFDLVLLDIYMRGISGTDAAKKIKGIDEKCTVIFITTSTAHAMESYDVNAFYYLVKPVEYSKFGEVMNKYVNDSFYVKSVDIQSGRQVVKVFLSDIVYVEACNKKIIIHTKSQDIETGMSLAKIEKMLGNNDFYKPIRYAIVSLWEVRAVINNEIVMNTEVRLPISRNEKEKFKEKFAEFKWRKIRLFE